MNTEQIKFILLIGTTILVWGTVFISTYFVAYNIKLNIEMFFSARKKEKKTPEELKKETEINNKNTREFQLINGRASLALEDMPENHYREEITCRNCSFSQDFFIYKGITREDFGKDCNCMRCGVGLSYKK